MDFSERIQDVAKRLQLYRDAITNEQATKNSLIEPFIKVLGYDTSNPLEVALEYTDPDTYKKDSRVDYAILGENGSPIILIEAKSLGVCLESKASQLDWYFHKTNARIGILTDGNKYQFFSDTEEKNKMDAKPFMEITLESLDQTLIPELRKLTKDNFDIDDLLDAAGKMKNHREFKRILAKQFEEPDDGFIKFFFRQTAPQGSMFTNAAKERVTPVLKAAMKQFLSEMVKKRLYDAADQQDDESTPANEELIKEEKTQSQEQSSKIQTTELEIEAYYLVKSLLIGVVDLDRVYMRDAVQFCNILLDDSIRKPIFRLYFNNEERLRVATIDLEKNEVIIEITSLDDILPLADKIRERAKAY